MTRQKQWVRGKWGLSHNSFWRGYCREHILFNLIAIRMKKIRVTHSIWCPTKYKHKRNWSTFQTSNLDDKEDMISMTETDHLYTVQVILNIPLLHLWNNLYYGHSITLSQTLAFRFIFQRSVKFHQSYWSSLWPGATHIPEFSFKFIYYVLSYFFSLPKKCSVECISVA